MYLKSTKFTPTKQFKDFAENFRKSVLEDTQLIDALKLRTEEEKKANVKVSPDRVMEALKGLRDRFENDARAENAHPSVEQTFRHLSSLVETLNRMQTVADNIDLSSVQPDEQKRTAAENAWKDAVRYINGMNGYSFNNPDHSIAEEVTEKNTYSMLESAKNAIKGSSTNGDGDEVYDNIQKDPAGLALLRCADLAANGMMSLGLLDREIMYSNFLNENHELPEFDRQEEIDFFSQLTEEDRHILKMTPEEQNAELSKMVSVANELRNRVDGRLVDHYMLRDSHYAVKRDDEWDEEKENVKKQIEAEAHRDVKDKIDEYQRSVVNKNENNKVRNAEINKRNAQRQQRRDDLTNRISQTKEELSNKLRELDQTTTRESYIDSLSGEEGSPKKHSDRIDYLTSNGQQLDRRKELLTNAMTYPLMLQSTDAPSIENQRKMIALEKQFQELDRLETFKRKEKLVQNGVAYKIPIETDPNVLKKMGKDWDAVQSLYADRDKAVAAYDKASDSKRDKSKEKIDQIQKKIDESLQKYQETYGDKGAVYTAMRNLNSMFPPKKGEKEFFTPELLAKDNMLDITANFKNQVRSDINDLKFEDKDYYRLKDFMDDPAHQQLLKRSPEDLRGELNTLEDQIRDNSTERENEKKLLEASEKAIRDHAEEAKKYPTASSIARQKNDLQKEADRNVAALEEELSQVSPNEKTFKTFTPEQIKANVQQVESRLAADRYNQIMDTDRMKREEEKFTRDFCDRNRKEYRAPYVEKYKAVDGRVEHLVQALGIGKDSPNAGKLNQLYEKRRQRDAQVNQLGNRWAEAQKPNRYPEELLSRLETLSGEINAGKKKGHKDSPEFSDMASSLNGILDFLKKEPDGPANMEKLRNMDPETVKQLDDKLGFLNAYAGHYLHEKTTTGIHIFPSNMRQMRLRFAESLQDFATKTQGNLKKLAEIEATQPARCEEAIQQAQDRSKVSIDVQDMDEFIDDAFNYAHDEDRDAHQKEALEFAKQYEASWKNISNEMNAPAEEAPVNEAPKAAEPEVKEVEGPKAEALMNELKFDEVNPEAKEELKVNTPTAFNDKVAATLQKWRSEMHEFIDRLPEHNELSSTWTEKGAFLASLVSKVEQGGVLMESKPQDRMNFLKQMAELGKFASETLDPLSGKLPEEKEAKEQGRFRFNHIVRNLVQFGNTAAKEYNEIAQQIDPKAEKLEEKRKVPKDLKKAHDLKEKETEAAEYKELFEKGLQRIPKACKDLMTDIKKTVVENSDKYNMLESAAEQLTSIQKYGAENQKSYEADPKAFAEPQNQKEFFKKIAEELPAVAQQMSTFGKNANLNSDQTKKLEKAVKLLTAISNHAVEKYNTAARKMDPKAPQLPGFANPNEVKKEDAPALGGC